MKTKHHEDRQLGPAAEQTRITPRLLFADNRVLPRGVALPVFGTAAPGRAVVVTFALLFKMVRADSAGLPVEASEGAS